MTRTAKFLAIPLAALTVIGALAVSTGEAEARRWRGGYGYGFGAAAAIFTAAAIAAAAAPRCHLVEVVNRRGRVVGHREVCG
jgi:hypothetical protein